MSRLGDRQAEILAAIRAGSLRVATSGRFSAPGVILEPADPWSEPARMPGRTARYQLTAVAGTPDSDAALGQLAEIIDAVDAALRKIVQEHGGKSVDGEIAHAVTVGTFTVSL